MVHFGQIRLFSCIIWVLLNQNVKESSEHLGLVRSGSSESQVNVSSRISLARRTLYSLMKTGMHGSNGLNPKKVQVGKDQEKAQSEKDSHSKNRGGKKPNQQPGTYTMKQS